MTSRPRLVWKLLPFHIVLSLATVGGILLLIGKEIDARDIALSAVLGLVAAAAGFAAIWRISRSLAKTRDGARRFADGDLRFRLDEPRSEELGGLAETLNQMAAQLNDRITTVNRQRVEQDAILGSMVEGVIALDPDARILQINPAAAHLFGANPDELIGRNLHEVVRNHNLQTLIERSVATDRPTEGEVMLHGETERSLQVHCTALRGADRAGLGVLVVLNDITRLRRLERVRRDFVANVSHELKTPLTSIKGFVETLLDGAIDQPEEAKRFCAIIAKQVDRLQAIIEDLLSLSRIEQEVERGQIALKESVLQDVLQSAVQTVSHQAAEKQMTVTISCDPSYTAMINAPLMEQVAVNLIDNAIKYSEPGKSVSVDVARRGDGWEIRFADQGFGIDSAHINRIFERFYRVDKARSRKAGGTGLGLAIVRHIVSAHGGRIHVESAVGRGTTFTVYLPHTARDSELPAGS